MSFFNALFGYLTVPAGIVAIWAWVGYFTRQRYAEVLLAQAPVPQIERILRLRALTARLMKIMLWASPFYILILPGAVYLADLGLNALPLAALCAAMEVGCLAVFLESRWLCSNLKAQSGAEKMSV